MGFVEKYGLIVNLQIFHWDQGIPRNFIKMFKLYAAFFVMVWSQWKVATAVTATAAIFFWRLKNFRFLKAPFFSMPLYNACLLGIKNCLIWNHWIPHLQKRMTLCIVSWFFKSEHDMNFVQILKTNSMLQLFFQFHFL